MTKTETKIMVKIMAKIMTKKMITINTKPVAKQSLHQPLVLKFQKNALRIFYCQINLHTPMPG